MKPWDHIIKPLGIKLINGSFKLGSNDRYINSDGIRVELTDSYDGLKDKRGVKLGHENQSPVYVTKREALLLSEFFQTLSETL